MNRFRVLVVSAAATVAVLGLGLVAGAIARSVRREAPGAPVDYLAQSSDACVLCHRKTTPGIVEQYAGSRMAAAKVSCRDCHVVPEGTPGAIAHEGAVVQRSPSPARCRRCHEPETAQFLASRHSLPSYVAYAGAGGLSPEHRKLYEAIPEREPVITERATLFAIEGPAITAFACQTCHDVGRPREDGSIGRCEKCHLRHEFSLEQVRKPETCNNCHIGPDHPQFEIYEESPHGIMYATGGAKWAWDARPGTLGPKEMPAPTCATCHISGFGAASTTHNVGERLSWYLFAPVSAHRPAWQDNKVRMQAVCLTCHNRAFIDGFYERADVATAQVNDWVRESQAMMKRLEEKGLLSKAAFDDSIKFEAFELWHHWGRTAKFGVWMQGPDYTQWHGAYEVVKALKHLEEDVAERERRGK